MDNNQKQPKYTIKEFRAQYPDEASCLDKIFSLRFGNMECCPECGKKAEFKRITTRRSYQCRFCYFQIYPTAGTVFEKTRTPLTYWFFAIFLMTTTRNGVAAKEIQRLLGVTYKTAWRMAQQIRQLMAGTSEPLSGYIEMDESYVGGKESNKPKSKRPAKSKLGRDTSKAAVFGMVERGGKVKATHVDNVTHNTILPIINDGVDKDNSVISTDEFPIYEVLTKLGYDHHSINHRTEQYRYGFICTNTIEGYWSNLKRMIRGTHIHVSPKYLQRYINECSFRYNHRDNQAEMFMNVLNALPQV